MSPTALLLDHHPSSVHALYGTSVSFNCTLSTNGLLTQHSILWRHNGSITLTQYPSHWSVLEGEWPASTLTITNITAEDTGYYECLAQDGLNSDGVYVSMTVSKRAWLNRDISTQQAGEASILA